MAEGKKSFILYCDLMEIVHELSDEEAGKLVKHIVDYVNDKEPKIENRFISLAFLPIKNALKSDLKKWEKTRGKRAESGKLGGLAKAEKNKQKLANVANAKNDKQKLASPSKSKQNLANLPVNVNVNVNDINNNRSFVVDANSDLVQYRTYFFQLIKQKQVSRDVLLKNSKIDLSRRNELWEAFILNAISETPQIEDEKHAWNCFKKFIKDNAKQYQIKESMLNHNWE